MIVLTRTGKNRRTTRIVALAALLLLMLAAAGCGGPGEGRAAAKTGDGTKGSGAETSGGTQKSGVGAIEASIETLDGEEFDLTDKRGDVVALFFMAGWCGSCIPEAQAWSKLYPAYKDKGLDLLVVSLDPNDSPETIAGFKRAGGIGELPWAIDETGEFTRSLDVRALDSTIIVDREGKVAYRDAAPTDAKTLESKLKEVF